MASSPRLSQLLDHQHRPDLGVNSRTAEQLERIEELMKEFKSIDEDGNNILTFDEVYRFLSERAPGFSRETCLILFNQMDRDQNSEVTTKEFVEHYVMIEDSQCKKINEQKIIIQDNRALLEENRKKLNKALSEEVMMPNGIMKDSVLTVHVDEVMNFRLFNVGIFIELYCNGQVIETEPQPFDKNPKFKETFSFQIKSDNAVLRIVLVDSKSKNKVAENTYRLQELRDQFKKDVIVDVHDGKNEGYIGRVHLELQWIWSRKEYLKKIIGQIEDNLLKNNQDLEEMEKSLKDLHKPFGIFDFRGNDYGGSADPVARRVTNVFFGVFGRNIRWQVMLSGFVTSYLLCSAFNMFFVPDYLNVIAT